MILSLSLFEDEQVDYEPITITSTGEDKVTRTHVFFVARDIIGDSLNILRRRIEEDV